QMALSMLSASGFFAGISRPAFASALRLFDHDAGIDTPTSSSICSRPSSNLMQLHLIAYRWTRLSYCSVFAGVYIRTPARVLAALGLPLPTASPGTTNTISVTDHLQHLVPRLHPLRPPRARADPEHRLRQQGAVYRPFADAPGGRAGCNPARRLR